MSDVAANVVVNIIFSILVSFVLGFIGGYYYGKLVAYKKCQQTLDIVTSKLEEFRNRWWI